MSSVLKQCCVFADSDTEEISDSQTSSDEPSSSVADISPKSAKIAVVTAFQGNCLQDLSLKAHIIPLAKKLGVRHRSKGKYELMEPLAKELFNQGYVKSQDDGDVNLKKLKRNMLKVCKPLFDEYPLLTLDSSEDSFGHDEDQQ